ncbi:MAG TPA: cupredoxin domain-containing protein [Chloroflexota bacterium]|nr:cupredoxin domain-containing protein [Chloroflexota bacterium]
MHFSRAEIAAWIIAVLIVGVMAVIVFTGPYHHINKVVAKSAYPAVTVKIENAPASQAQLIGIYVPKTIRVHVGQTINFTNVSDVTHTVTSNTDVFDSFDINKGGATWSYTPSRTGNFPYYCKYHQFMHGSIVVTG